MGRAQNKIDNYSLESSTSTTQGVFGETQCKHKFSMKAKIIEYKGIYGQRDDNPAC